MSGNQFIPKMNVEVALEQDEISEAKEVVKVSRLLQFAQATLVALFALVPLFFTPGLFASLGFDKTLLAISLSFLVIVLLSFLALRTREVSTVMPVSLGLYWLVVLVSLISGSLSGDSMDAIRGNAFEVQTVGFLAVLGLVMSTVLVLQKSKKMTLIALVAFAGSSSLLILYNLLRLVFGPGFLPFDSFDTVTVSPIGNFNDLAIFSGLLIVLAFITLIQLPVRAVLQYVIAAGIFASLAILTIVNFVSIWIVVGLFSLLVLMYLLTRDTLFDDDSKKMSSTKSRVLLATSAVVCIASALFVIAGNYASEKVSSVVNVEYVQVLPSVEATINIVRAVYVEDLLLGVGPNRFADAWRMHREQSINETIFWDTDFTTGSGYIPTFFITLGLLGGILFVMFHVWFLYLGYKMLLRTNVTDPYWYYLGAVSFSAAVFVWGMSYVYEPGAAVLLTGALFTGLTFVAAGSLLPKMLRTIPLVVNRQRGFFIMALVIIIIPAIIASLLSIGKQYVAQSGFAQTRTTTQSIEEFEKVAIESFALFQDDRFVSDRAQIHLASLNAIVRIENPTKEDEQRFLNEAEQARLFIDQALEIDPTNPDNHAILAGVYSALAVAGIGEAQIRAEDALAQAQRLDPLNPGYNLIGAQMAARTGDSARAREELVKALALKSNFTEALFLSAQLDIGEGNVESAIATTRSIISLEPRNPTRYFQLGMLLSADEVYEEAIVAFQTAIILDPEYANARYLLALTYLSSDQEALALEQLRIVEVTNPNNPQVEQLKQQISEGEEFVSPDLGFEIPITDLSLDGVVDDIDSFIPTTVDLEPSEDVSNETESVVTE
jgi:tetratricopeptide (TPR) repeat protein